MCTVLCLRVVMYLHDPDTDPANAIMVPDPTNSIPDPDPANSIPDAESAKSITDHKHCCIRCKITYIFVLQ